MIRFDAEEYLKAFSEFIEQSTVVKNQASFCKGSLSRQSQYHLLCRSVIVRQYEYLDFTKEACRIKRANFSTLGLRPAFEELVWLRYIRKIPFQERERLLVLLTQNELARRYKAQATFFGDGDAKRRGFPKQFVLSIPQLSKRVNASISELKSTYGWHGNKLLPSVSDLAGKVDLTKEYNFIYEGSSRCVHFSTQELLRMVWGDKERTYISFRELQDYWMHFSIYWSVFIFSASVAAIPSEAFPADSELNTDKMLAAAEKLGKYGTPPILTPEECNFI
jgi:hypothetical protein